MNRWLPSGLAAIGLALGVFAGARGWGPLPPLGGVLDPANGAWAAARFADLPRRAEARIPNLAGPVEVRYDRRGVPHIFAGSEEDAIRALGYVTARDRLFQLETQTRAASGRLTEWAGGRVMELDQEMRRLGLPRAAERALASLAPGSVARRVVDAYADGVNAFIDGLARAGRPIEYKLLGARPERWAPINSLHLFNRMGWTLTYLEGEMTRLAAASMIGERAAQALFPVNAVLVEPIVPNGAGRPRFDFRKLPPPGVPDSEASRVISALSGARPPWRGETEPDSRRSLASNNWAVSPRRTGNGHALLAGDPHLDLTLPSIWYEAHLVVPGRLDVYGVTIPGAPGVIIGFNRDVAWSFTNTGADVLDFFRETVDDTARPGKYLVDGVWRPIERRVETYRGKHGEGIGVDTLLFTHRGPLSRRGRAWLSMRWRVLESRPIADVFIGAAGARSTRELLDALARGWDAPAQNVLAADRSGAIAIRSTGHYPIRAGRGDGLAIRDGSTSASDWLGSLPVSQYPQSFDPPQGFLASANQQPVDPRATPPYLGYESAFDPWRALHINRLLRADSAVTTDAMRRYQTDPGSARADLFVPFFLRAARSVGSRGGAPPRLDTAAAMLAAWDRRYTKETSQARLFEAARSELVSRTWDELSGGGGRRVATPTSEVLFELLQDSTSGWWDDRRTRDRVERRDDIVAASLVAAYDTLVKLDGPPRDGGWRWDRRGSTRLTHILGLRGFSASDIPVQGGPATLNPAGPGGFGPSWRMVVELGPDVRGYGTYPGGQSGNPASARYLDRLPLWRDGLLDTLFMPRDTAALAAANVLARLRLIPDGRR
jgi:penicillin amidase